MCPRAHAHPKRIHYDGKRARQLEKGPRGNENPAQPNQISKLKAYKIYYKYLVLGKYLVHGKYQVMNPSKDLIEFLQGKRK